MVELPMPIYISFKRINVLLDIFKTMNNMGFEVKFLRVNEDKKRIEIHFKEGSNG